MRRKLRWKQSAVGAAVAAAAIAGALVSAGDIGPAHADGDPSDVVAPGYDVRTVVPGDDLSSTSGMAFDSNGDLLIAQALDNRISRLDLDTGELTVIAQESEGDLVTGLLTSRPLLVPDDLAVGPDGDLFVANILGKNVSRMSPDGTQRRIVGLPPLGDVITGPNGIAFNAEGRLFVTDLTFSSATHPGGMWEVDPSGLIPPIPIVRGLPGPEGFQFGPDGLAYVPMLFGGRIDVIDVDARTVRTLVDGFGNLTSLKIDGEGRLVVVEASSGSVWRVDRVSGARALIADGPPGIDNLAIAADGTIYTSNFVSGNVSRVDEATGSLVPVLPAGDLSFPFQLNEGPDGSVVVGDFTSVSRVDDDGTVERVNSLLVSDVQLLTPGADYVGGRYHYSDFFLPPGNVFNRDTAGSDRQLGATGFVFPWHVEEGRAGKLLVSDQAAGTVFEVDPATGSLLPVLTGLLSPSGLAFDAQRRVVYASSTGLGQVVAARAINVLGVELFVPLPLPVLSGLDDPEGIDVLPDGSLVVVEGGSGRLLRVDPNAHAYTELATGFATDTVGFGLPTINYSADVLVRPDGRIFVSGSADGSLIELTPN